MVRTLPLPPSQQEALRAAFERTYGEFEEALSGEEGAKLITEEKAVRRGTKARDLAGARRITRQKET